MRKLGPLVSNKMQTIFPQNHLRDTRIILASGSPRRKEILEKIGLDFEVRYLCLSSGIESCRVCSVTENLVS